MGRKDHRRMVAKINKKNNKNKDKGKKQPAKLKNQRREPAAASGPRTVEPGPAPPFLRGSGDGGRERAVFSPAPGHATEPKQGNREERRS